MPIRDVFWWGYIHDIEDDSEYVIGNLLLKIGLIYDIMDLVGQRTVERGFELCLYLYKLR